MNPMQHSKVASAVYGVLYRQNLSRPDRYAIDQDHMEDLAIEIANELELKCKIKIGRRGWWRLRSLWSRK